MNSKTFFGKDIQEALETVRAELGPDAIIVATRSISKKKVLGKDEQGIEITAIPGDPKRQHQDIPKEQQNKNLQAIQKQMEMLRKDVRKMMYKQELSGSHEEAQHMRRELIALGSELSNAKNILYKMMYKIPNERNKADNPFDRLVSILKARGVEQRLAHHLVERAVNESKSTSDFNKLVERTAHIIRSQIKVSKPIWQLDKPRIAALIGSTGVGKTTTIAKIAAHARLSGIKDIALISADSNPISSAQQLKRYAEAIDVPFTIARSKQELFMAIDELSKKARLVLIDTAGVSPENRNGITRLSELLDRQDIERHLVLNPSLPTIDLPMVLEAYAQIGYNTLLFTKMDESRNHGLLITAQHISHCAVSHLCSGQRVPEDVEEAKVQKISSLVMSGFNAA